MNDPVVVLLAVQIGLMALIVAAVLFIGGAALRSLNAATALLDNMRSTMEMELRPTLRDARATLTATEDAVTRAAETLKTAAPALNALGSFAQKANERATPLWLDAAKLGYGIIRSVKNGKQKPLQKDTNYV